jgi:hypothetical protein
MDALNRILGREVALLQASIRQSSTAHNRSPPSVRAHATTAPSTDPLRSPTVRPSSSTAPPSASTCVRPLRSRSFDSPPPTMRGDRRADRPQIEAKATLLSGHARRSRVSGGDITLASQPSGDVRNRVTRRQPELSASNQTAHPYGDTELGNAPDRLPGRPPLPDVERDYQRYERDHRCYAAGIPKDNPATTSAPTATNSSAGPTNTCSA